MALKKKPAKSVKTKKSAPKKSNKKTVKPAKKKVAEPSRLKDMINRKSLGTGIGCSDVIRNVSDLKMNPPVLMPPVHPIDPDFDLKVKQQLSGRTPKMISAIKYSKQTGNSRMISVTVRNVTNYTLRDVVLFDNEFEKNYDVHYSTESKDVNYKEMLRRKNSIDKPDTFVGMINIMSKDTNQPFRTLLLIDTDIDGTKLSIPITPILDPHQNQSGVVNIKFPFGFYVGTNIIISSLNPDSKVTYNIFLTYPNIDTENV